MKPARVPRLLLLLPQLPQDPASGAARSLTSICELLNYSGWRVRALQSGHDEAALPDLAAVQGVVIQKSVPGRRRLAKRYI